MRAAAMRRGLPAAGVEVPSDKRFRRPDVRPGRRGRFGAIGWRGLAMAAAAALVLAGLAYGLSAIVHSHALAVDRIDVRGTSRMAPAEVEAVVDGLRGQSLLLADLDAARRRLLDSPWIADAHLRRVLPSTVVVDVVERSPMAAARLGRQLYLVDATGVIIDEYGAQYAALDLPIVDGLAARGAAAGAPLVDAARAAFAGVVLDALVAQPELRARVSEIDVSDLHDAVVLVDGDAARLHLGDDDFAARLTRYLELAPTLKDKLGDLDYVDLRFDRLYVRALHPGASAARPGRQ